ncbi:hypothetical protein [Paenibacillus sp. AGC30]
MTDKSIHHFIEVRDSFESLQNYNMEYNIYNRGVITDKNSIWRYMDFSKFVSLLDKKELFFSNPSLFRDPYEGAYSERDFVNLIGEPYSYIPDLKYDFDIRRESLIERTRNILNYVGVSCWHLNEEESAAMWDLYLGTSNGIAIKTSISNLINSFDHNEYDLFFGEVQYINYLQDMASQNAIETLFYKRQSFSHENEFRLIVFEDPDEQFFSEYGVNVQCNLEVLIDDIYVSPTSPSWFKDVVQSVTNKYDLESKRVIQSNLYSGPRSVF